MRWSYTGFTLLQLREFFQLKIKTVTQITCRSLHFSYTPKKLVMHISVSCMTCYSSCREMEFRVIHKTVRKLGLSFGCNGFSHLSKYIHAFTLYMDNRQPILCPVCSAAMGLLTRLGPLWRWLPSLWFEHQDEGIR